MCREDIPGQSRCIQLIRWRCTAGALSSSDATNGPCFFTTQLPQRERSSLGNETVARCDPAAWPADRQPPARPTPADWTEDRITAAWLGHATVLINFFGLTILTDPALFPRIGIRLPGITLGPRRLIAPALNPKELPKIDLVLVSHAHFDHLDRQTLRFFDSSTHVVTATRTRDLFPGKRCRDDLSELHWGESKTVTSRSRSVKIMAFPVKHWGARLHYDNYRGYNGYLIEREGRRIIFSGDTALSDTFISLRDRRGIDLAIMGIGCYNPWIRTHCTPEQAVRMANDAAARFILPYTIKLSASASNRRANRSPASKRPWPGNLIASL